MNSIVWGQRAPSLIFNWLYIRLNEVRIRSNTDRFLCTSGNGTD